MYSPLPDFNMLHGVYIRPTEENGFNDAIVAAIKNVKTNEHKLHVIRNPMFEYWVTKPQFRHQNIRLECERLERLEQHVCKYKELWDSVGKALGIYKRTFNNNIQKADPHVYGVDVGPLIRMKIEYMQNVNDVIPKLDIGMLDIETSVIPEFDNQILCASYTDWSTRTTFEFINKPWCNVDESVLRTRLEQETEPFVEGLNEKAKKAWDANPHKFEFVFCENERELIIHLIRSVVIHKPDLCGVWNIAFDIPFIEERAKFNQIPLEQLFCHPDVPKDLRFFHWKQDTKPVEHFTDVWHQVEVPGYTRWYDPMCLYSRLRKVQGRENFYTLEYIGQKIIGSGKIKFGVNKTHTDMQLHDQVGYCVYNCFDTVLPCLIDAVTGDTTSMMILVGISEISEYSKQTVMLKNNWFNYCRSSINSISGSIVAPSSMSQEWDKFLANIGGAVLSPNLLEVKGTRHLKEMSAETSIEMLVNDIDAALTQWRLSMGNYGLKTSLTAGTL